MSENLMVKEELQEAMIEVRKKKLKKKIISAAVIVGILALILAMIWVYGYNYAKNKANDRINELTERIYALENTPVVLDPITPEIVQSVLSKEIKNISELATCEYAFTNAAKFTDTKHIVEIFDWMTEKSFVQKWDGVIKAGVKLEDLSVNVSDTVIQITLSPAEILSYEVDYDSIEVLDEKNNIFNPISIEDKNAFDNETKNAMIERAIENGLLEKAQKNAEDIIEALLTTYLYDKQEYTVEFICSEN